MLKISALYNKKRKMIDLKAKGEEAIKTMEEMGLCGVLIDFYKWWSKTKGTIF